MLNSQVNSNSFGTPDLVTVNMGGDDQSFFAHVAVACIFQYDSKACGTTMDAASKIIQGLGANYDAVFAGVKKKTHPSTKVVAMSYAQFWGRLDAQDCAWPFNQPTSAEKGRMNTLARDMNTQLKGAALRAGYLYGDVDAAFEGHRLCDQAGASGILGSWFQTVPKLGFDTDGNWYWEVPLMHPTEAGQDAMLKVLTGVLGC